MNEPVKNIADLYVDAADPSYWRSWVGKAKTP